MAQFFPDRATGEDLPIGGGSVESNDLDSAVEKSHAALHAILNGDASLYLALYSGAEDVTLGNPFGPYARGRKNVEATLAGAAAHYRDGEVTGVEPISRYVSDDLACIVEVERGRAKVGGRAEIVALALRVTSVFRLEQGAWKPSARGSDYGTTASSVRYQLASVISK